MNSIERRLTAIEVQLAKKNAESVSPAVIRVMNELADRVREAALDPDPRMRDVARAYAGVILPMHGQRVPAYEDDWIPGERYWREVARIIGHTGLPNSAEVSAGMNRCLDEEPDSTVQALNAIDERHRRGQR
jgi:hypothetical protein